MPFVPLRTNPPSDADLASEAADLSALLLVLLVCVTYASIAPLIILAGVRTPKSDKSVQKLINGYRHLIGGQIHLRVSFLFVHYFVILVSFVLLFHG